MNFLHTVVISIAIYDGVSTLFTEDLLLPTYCIPFLHESHSVWFIYTLPEPRGERRLTALLKATHGHLCYLEWKRTLQQELNSPFFTIVVIILLLLQVTRATLL